MSSSTLEQIKKLKSDWLAKKVAKVLEETPELKQEFKTYSNLPVDRLYTPADVEIDYLRDLCFPGAYPYTRGIQPTMYRGRLWTMRQYAGFGTAYDTNKRYKYLLQQGQTGLSVAFDLPTQIGYDSDETIAKGEVGRVGVAVDTIDDIQTLFDGIPLHKVSTSMTINATAPIILAMYIAVAQEQGAEIKELAGTVQNDILKEYIARGAYRFPPKPSIRLAVDIIEYCTLNLPHWNTISVSGYHIREAGSTAVQEIAFTLSNGIAYVEAALERGLKIDTFGPRISFFFNAHNDFFEEITKFRAARRLWAKIMKERFGAKNPKSMQLRFHTQTAGCTLTSQEPMNNIVRVTLQALAAVLGGTQSLHTNSMDEALGLPTENAVKIALRTQQIIGLETNVTSTTDPLGGSFFVEALTNELEAAAWRYIKKIDDLGGAVAAIEKGFMQTEIANAAYEFQKSVEKQNQIIVGVNKFQSSEKSAIKLLQLDDRIETDQIKNLSRIKETRDDNLLKASLNDLEIAAKKDDNLMPYFLNCVQSYATVGEICKVLCKVFGEYKALTVV